jgi:hypothetical protein
MALRSPCYLSILLFAAAASTGHAAELGEAQVQSHIGQALVADVELSLVEDDANPVRVRLANPDVYRGANIAMPAVLSSLNMTVMRRDGRQFLHVTSLKPVESRHLHLYLELLDGAQRNVRLVTLWLTPDPNPAPPVRDAQTAQTVPAPPIPAPARKPVPAARPVAALQTGEEYVDPAPARHKRAAPKPVPAARVVVARKPAPVPESRTEAPSCAAQASAEHLDACVALGEKNTALHHDLVKLEEKVKALQGAAASAVPAAAPGAAPAPAPAAKQAPKEAPRIHRKPKTAEPPAEESPWLLIGAAIAAVSAIAGLAMVLLGRRKRAGFGKIPAAHKPAKLPKATRTGKAPAAHEGEPKPNFMAAVKARLMAGRGKDAASTPAAPVAEPVLTEVISQPE